MPVSLFIKNRKKLKEALPANSIAIFNSNDEYPRNGDQFFPFRQNSDLFYLTGIEQPESSLLIFPDCPNEVLREVLVIRRGSEKLETWEGHQLTADEAKQISGMEKVRYTDEILSIINEMMVYAGKVFLNNYEYPKYQCEIEYKDLRFGRELKQRFPNHEYARLAPLMHKLRMIKEEEEIDLIRRAINITDKALHRILRFVKPGVTEFQVQAEIDHEFTINRARGHAYRPIIASGKNACVLHYTENKSDCLDGDLLLMDFGAEFNNYAADLTRTIPVSGKFSSRQRQCYAAVLRVQKEAIKLMRPGITIDKINKEVNTLMEKEMVELGLLKEDEIVKQDAEKPLYLKYFMHGTCHPIGLDVHDVGSKYDTLQAGMVLTVEPGLYVREENMGIRLENNILITDAEPVDLTANIPIEAGDIEKLMR
jgi:Xaa-Pro aminopeptidase